MRVRRVVLLIALLCGMVISLVPPRQALAATITVNTTDDTDDGVQCSLRDAIQAANTDLPNGACLTPGSGDDVIDLTGLTGTITLNLALPTITSNITITGPGIGTLTISGNNASRVIEITSGTVNINNITLSDGNTGSVNGAVIRNAATLTLDNVVVSNGTTLGLGGGVLNDAFGQLTVTNSTFTNNDADLGGGAIANIRGTARIYSSTLYNNRSAGAFAGRGGAIYNSDEDTGTTAFMTIANSTLSANQANGAILGQGGAVYNKGSVGGASLIILNSTIAYNGVTGATLLGSNFYNDGGNANIEFTNTISASGLFTDECAWEVNAPIDNGNNISQDGTCGATFTLDDPLLSGLGDNGGPTETHSIPVSSPAFDAGDNTTCLAAPVNNLDQRGETRTGPGNATCDIGAYERQPSTAVYDSTPAPGAIINVGSSPAGVTISTTLTVRELGTETLQVRLPAGGALSGPGAGDYALVNGPDFDILDGGAEVDITIQCTPSQGGARDAVLTFQTNDINLPTVTYTLQCTGLAPVYASNPIPGSIIDLGQTGIGLPITGTLTVSEAGTADLDVTAQNLTGDTGDITVSAGGAPFTIVDGGVAHDVTLQCSPTVLGQREVTLEFTTNDPGQPTVSYTVRCTGRGPGFTSNPAPGSVNLGETPVGTPVSVNIVVGENGFGDLQVTSQSLTGDVTEFGVVSSVPFTIVDNSGSTSTISVTCTPTIAGSHAATLTLTTNDPDQPSVVYNLACVGRGPEYTSNPVPTSNIDFGVVAADGVATVTSNLVVTNTGPVTLNVTEPAGGAFTGADAAYFSFASGGPPFSIAAAGPDQTVTLQCQTTEQRVLTATLTLETNDIFNPSVSYTLICEGRGPVYSSNPADGNTLDMGVVAADGVTTATTTLDVDNLGLTTLNVSAPVGGVITGLDASEFSIISGGPPFSIIASGPTNTVTIQCQTTLERVLNATLIFDTNDPNAPTVSYPLTCEGRGAVYDSTPGNGSTLDTGVVAADGVATATTTLAVNNLGLAALNVSVPAGGLITGADAAAFSVISNGPPFSIAASGPTNTVTVQCQTTEQRVLNATLNFDTNDPNAATVSYPLTCTGRGAIYSSNPVPGDTIALGVVAADGVATTTAPLAVDNLGLLALDVTVPVGGLITGPDASSFSVISNGPPFTVAVGGLTNTLTIQCQTTTAGNLTATLNLASNDPNNALVSYTLTCQGAGPEYSSTPVPTSLIDLGTTALGVMTSTNLTVDNLGATTLSVLPDAGGLFTGANPGDFSLTNGPPFNIASGGASHIVTIECTPTAGGTRTATLNFETNDINAPTVSYDLTCNSLTAGYDSNPAPGSAIDVGSARIGDSSDALLVVSENGDVQLDVTVPAGGLFSGPNAAEFSLVDGPPFSIANGAADHTVTIKCSPLAGGLRSAQLTLATNDPGQPTVTYDLTCTGLVPAYGSVPPPGSTINVGTSSVNVPISTTFTVQEVGDDDLTVSSPQITGTNASDFSLSGVVFPFTILDGGPNRQVTVTCRPGDFGTRTATLQLSTNDPAQPTVSYPLECEGAAGFPVQVFSVADPDSAIDGQTAVTYTVSVVNLSQTDTITDLRVEDPSSPGDYIPFQVNLQGVPITPFALPPNSFAVASYTINPVTAANPGNVVVVDNTWNGGVITETGLAEINIFTALQVTNTANKLNAEAGEVVTYTVVVNNFSGSPITNLRADNPGSPGSNIAFSVQGGAATQAPFTLPPGQSAVGTYQQAVVGGMPTFSSTVNVNDGASLSFDAVATVNVVDATPGISFTKSASPTSGVEGTTITYTLVVTNTGTSNITSMIVNDSMFGGDITGRFNHNFGSGPLAPGNSTQAVLTQAINPGSGNPIVNIASVTATTAAGATLFDTADAAVTVTNTSSDTLRVTVLADNYAPAVGERVNFTAIITNNTASTLTNLSATAFFPSGAFEDLVLSANALAAGSSAIASFDYVIGANDGPIAVVQVSASGQVGFQSRVGSGSATLTLDVSAGAIFSDLRAVDCEPPCALIVGQRVPLQATVVNTGLSPLTNVIMTSPDFGNLLPNPISLLPGDNYAVELEYIVPLGLSGGVVFEINVSGVDVEGETVNHSFVLLLGVVTNAQISLTSTTSQTSVANGGQLAYTTTITNTGRERITNLGLTDTLTGAIDLVGLGLPTSINPGTQLVIETNYTVGNADSDPLVNVVLVTGVVPTLNNLNVSDTDAFVVNVQRPGLVVNLVADRISATVGETVNYTVTLFNVGDGPISGLAGAFSILSGAPIGPQPPTTPTPLPGGQQRPALQGGTITLGTDTLAQGAATTGVFSITTTSALPSPLTVRATATGSGLSGAATIVVSGEDDVVVVLVAQRDAQGNVVEVGTPIPGTADPIVEKVADSPFGLPGGIVVWTLTVRNPGEDPLIGVAVADTIDNSLTLETATSNIGTVRIDEAAGGTTIFVEAIPDLAFNQQVAVTIITRVTQNVQANELISNVGCATVGIDLTGICQTAQIRIAPDVSLLPTTGQADPPPASNSAGVLGGPLATLLILGLLGAMLADDDDDGDDAEPPGGGRVRLLAILALVVAAVVIVALLLSQVLNLGGETVAEDTPAASETVQQVAAVMSDTPTSEVLPSETPSETPPPPTPTPLPQGPPPTVPPTATPSLPPDFTPPPFTPGEGRELYIPRLAEAGQVPIVTIPLRNRTWDVRELGLNAGFLEGTTWVDEASTEVGGNTVLAAHVQLDMNTPGPFRHLNDVTVGDSIFLAADGIIWEYAVFDVSVVAPDDVSIAYPTSDQLLTLITCTGFSAFSNTFEERLIVRAHPVRSQRY